MKKIILLLLLILFICACKNNYIEYLNEKSNENNLNDEELNEKKNFDYLKNYKDIYYLSEQDSKEIFDSFESKPDVKS